MKRNIVLKLTVKGRTREQTVEGTAVAMVIVADREQASTSPQYLPFPVQQSVQYYSAYHVTYHTRYCSQCSSATPGAAGQYRVTVPTVPVTVVRIVPRYLPHPALQSVQYLPHLIQRSE